MAYYYLTSNERIYKTVGSRKVKRIFVNFSLQKQLVFGTTTLSSSLSGMVTMPMIRRVFPTLIAHDIVGVQPMSGPAGLAFALRYQYGPLRRRTFYICAGSKMIPKTTQVRIKYKIQKKRQKNTIPIQKFKEKHKIVLETANFYDIVFRTMMETMNG